MQTFLVKSTILLFAGSLTAQVRITGSGISNRLHDSASFVPCVYVCTYVCMYVCTRFVQIVSGLEL